MKDVAKENVFIYRETPAFHGNLSLEGYCTVYLGKGIRHSPVEEAEEANWMSAFKQIRSAVMENGRGGVKGNLMSFQ